MKHLLEAINRGILKGLTENNIELLADLDGDNPDLLDSILTKSINNKIDVSHLEILRAIKTGKITERLKAQVNNPKNFNRFKNAVKANDKNHLKKLIKIGLKLFGNDGNFNWIDTSEITNMSKLFDSNICFNGHIELWDVSKVTNMAGMFYYAEKFNRSIGDWDVSRVTNMEGMFYHADEFDLPIGDWDVSNVTNMSCMFQHAENFNLPIGNWDVRNVTDMTQMFCCAENFNLPIGNWNVSNVTDMMGMFYSAYKFNLPLNNWDIMEITTNISFLFTGCHIKEEYKPNNIR